MRTIITVVAILLLVNVCVVTGNATDRVPSNPSLERSTPTTRITLEVPQSIATIHQQMDEFRVPIGFGIGMYNVGVDTIQFNWYCWMYNKGLPQMEIDMMFSAPDMLAFDQVKLDGANWHAEYLPDQRVTHLTFVGMQQPKSYSDRRKALDGLAKQLSELKFIDTAMVSVYFPDNK